MTYVVRIIKKLFFWGYARNTWQYDVLCVLILAFIFLTPQNWFDGGSPMKKAAYGEPGTAEGHQKPVASKVILSIADNSSVQMTQSEIESRVRAITGRPETQVLQVQPRLDASHKIVAYEVDIQ